MKVIGVIVEYNPMHNGHVYHLQKTREIYQADFIIAVMSGHFLQRGEPAIADPWVRTQMALASGADLVLELPVLFSTSSAEKFAFGSVSLLHRLGVVKQICFGSESGDIRELMELAAFLENPPEGYLERLTDFYRQGFSHPKSHALALSEWFQNGSRPLWDQPNNMLGLEYSKALLRLRSSIQPVTVTRHGAGFHDEDYSHQAIASATAIRKSILSGDYEALNTYMPLANARFLLDALSSGDAPVTWNSFLPALRLLILRETKAGIERYAHVDEGLGDRILSAFRRDLPTFEDYVKCIKTKRFTWTHIQRALTSILLSIDKEQAFISGKQGAKYARVLGFTKNGQLLLREIHKKAEIPILSKLVPQMPQEIEFDLRAEHIYRTVTRTSGSKRFPVRGE